MFLLIGPRAWHLIQHEFAEGKRAMTTAAENLAAATTRLETAAAKLSADVATAVTELQAIANDTTDQAIADRINAVADNLNADDVALNPPPAPAAAGADTNSGGDASLA